MAASVSIADQGSKSQQVTFDHKQSQKERDIVATLAQTTLSSVRRTDSDRDSSATVFSLQPLHPITTGGPSAAPDSSSFLQQFMDEGILTAEAPLNLEPREERALREMFSQYHLQNRLCAVDLLLFEFYQSLSRIPQTTAEIELLIEEFYSDYFMGYLGIHYEYNKKSGALTPSKFFPKFFHSPDRFAALIERFGSKLNRFLSIWKDQRLVELRNKNSGQILEKKIENFKRAYALIIKELLSLSPKFSLMAKLLRHPQCCELLVQKNLLYYSGSNQLNVVNLEAGRDHCLKLTNCYSHVLVCAHKFKKSALYSYLEKPLKLLQKLEHRELTEPQVFQWQNSFQQFAKEIGGSWQAYAEYLRLAMNSELTYDQYKQLAAVPKERQMSQSEFIEYLLGLNFQFFIVDGWVTDLQRCTAHQIFQPRFPHLCYEPQSYTYRLVSNLNALSSIHENLTAQATTCLPTMGTCFQTHDVTNVQSLLEKCKAFVFWNTGFQARHLCDLLIDGKRFNFSQFMLDLQELSRITFSYSRWLETLRVFEPFLPTLDKILVEIGRNHKQMLAQLEDMVNKVAPTLSKDDREKLKSDIRKIVKQESLDLCRLIMIFADAEALIQRKDLDEESHLLPPELVDFMTVEGLDEIFEKVEASLSPQEPEPVVDTVEDSPGLSTTHDDLETLAQPQMAQLPMSALSASPDIVHIPDFSPLKSVAPKVSAAVRRVLSPLERAHLNEHLPTERDLKLAKRRRDLMDYVHKLGWWTDRIRGGHEIVTDGTRTVSIPGAGHNNKSLDRGTQHNIARALTEEDEKMRGRKI